MVGALRVLLGPVVALAGCVLCQANCSTEERSTSVEGAVTGGGASTGSAMGAGGAFAGGGSSVGGASVTMGGSGGIGGGLGSAGSIGAPSFQPGDLDAPSNGGTITFQNIGQPGWYPSRRDPATGPCDASNTSGCCKTKFTIAGDKLTPWDEDLIMTLRGPLIVKQLVTYQPSPDDAAHWQVVSTWEDRSPMAPKGMAFSGNGTETSGFRGVVGTECLVNVSTDRLFPCGPGSIPYCTTIGNPNKYYGWHGSKIFVLVSMMPYADSGKIGSPCSQTNTGNWYNAPWIGLSHGELVRAGAFGTCNCYSATSAYAGDGCGQRSEEHTSE